MKSETTSTITALGLSIFVVGFSVLTALGLMWATNIISSADSKALRALDERLDKLEAELPALRAEIAANARLMEWAAEHRRLVLEQDATRRDMRALEAQLDSPQTQDDR